MANIPASNRIHSLPVLVNYHIPTSSSSFTTLFATAQQVYVHAHAHANANAASSKGEMGDEEIWGSIYLKTVIQGVMMASPELHPFENTTPETSLYVLDPRETFLRRQRNANLPAHLRSERASSPAGPSRASPGPSAGASAGSSSSGEVWAGKGLLSWALNEAGQGKNLITGRLIRSTTFSGVASGKEVEGMGALEALMMADTNAHAEGVWGLEVNISMRTQGAPAGPMMGGMMGAEEHSHGQRPGMDSRVSDVVDIGVPVEFGRDRDQEAVSSTSVRPAAVSTRHVPRPESGAPPTKRGSSTSTSTSSPVTAPTNGQLPAVSSATRYRGTSGRKRKIPASTPPNGSDRALASLDGNIDLASIARAVRGEITTHKASGATGTALAIPAAVYNNPSSLTKDQVHRLLASPAFLDLLEKTAGQSLGSGTATATAVAALQGHGDGNGNRATGTGAGVSAKRVKHDHSGDHSSSNGGMSAELKCYNCGRTKSSVWRSRTMDDGLTVRVCNACGLYWNQRKEMRPPSLWSAVDDEVIEKPRLTRKPVIPRNPPSAALTARAAAHAAQARQAAAAASAAAAANGSASASFKRTLSAVANQDAQRIAARRPSTATVPARSGLSRSILPATSTVKPVPATSPAQCTRAKTMRNASWKNPHTTSITGIQGPGQTSVQGHGQGQAASSPGGWVHPTTRAVKAHEAFEPMSTIGENQSPALSTTTTMALNSQIQSLQLPTSEDGTGGLQQLQSNNWDTDISTLFDIDAYSESFDKDFDFSFQPEIQGLSNVLTQPLRRSPRKHTSKSRVHQQGQGRSDDDDTISNLFNSSSNGSPKSSFDFSALPPSSPPFMLAGGGDPNMAYGSGNSLLPHSTLLMSSPDFSPLSSMFGLSPVEPQLPQGQQGQAVQPRYTPEKNKGASGLRNSFTPLAMGREDSMMSNLSQPAQHSSAAAVGVGMEGFGGSDGNGNAPVMSIEEFTQVLNNSGMDQAAWDELFGLMGNADVGGMDFGMGGNGMIDGHAGLAQSATGMEGVSMDDEWTALINGLT